MKNDLYSIDIHADDYALSVNNSRRILQLIKDGKLDSISVIPNSSSFDECMEMLCESWESFAKKPLVSVHLNIADGYSLSGITDPMLTAKLGESRVFCASWGRLFLSLFVPGRREAIRAELKKEFAAQIKAVSGRLPAGVNPTGAREGTLRLDSHTHTHMIPVVFDAMTDAVHESGMADKLSFVRVSGEPLMPFIRITGTFPAVNLVKNLILNVLSIRARRKLRHAGVSFGILWGILMSGRMDKKRVELLLPVITEYARRRGEKLEILFHPGRVLQGEEHPEFSRGDDLFVRSDNRDDEYQAVTSVCR